MKILHLTIYGKVQKVGYRKWISEIAINKGINGWVANLKNGGVMCLIILNATNDIKYYYDIFSNFLSFSRAKVSKFNMEIITTDIDLEVREKFYIHSDIYSYQQYYFEILVFNSTEEEGIKYLKNIVTSSHDSALSETKSYIRMARVAKRLKWISCYEYILQNIKVDNIREFDMHGEMSIHLGNSFRASQTIYSKVNSYVSKYVKTSPSKIINNKIKARYIAQDLKINVPKIYYENIPIKEFLSKSHDFESYVIKPMHGILRNKANACCFIKWSVYSRK